MYRKNLPLFILVVWLDFTWNLSGLDLTCLGWTLDLTWLAWFIWTATWDLTRDLMVKTWDLLGLDHVWLVPTSVCYLYFDNKQGVIFQILSIWSRNSNNKWRFGALWCGVTDRCSPTRLVISIGSVRVNAIISSSVTEWTPEGLLKDTVLTERHHNSCNRSISVSAAERRQ